jgi:hypothetical protein
MAELTHSAFQVRFLVAKSNSAEMSGLSNLSRTAETPGIPGFVRGVRGVRVVWKEAIW